MFRTTVSGMGRRDRTTSRSLRGLPVTTAAHVAFAAEHRDAVDAFFTAALANRATKRGEPGVWTQYSRSRTTPRSSTTYMRTTSRPYGMPRAGRGCATPFLRSLIRRGVRVKPFTSEGWTPRPSAAVGAGRWPCDRSSGGGRRLGNHGDVPLLILEERNRISSILSLSSAPRRRSSTNHRTGTYPSVKYRSSPAAVSESRTASISTWSCATRATSRRRLSRRRRVSRTFGLSIDTRKLMTGVAPLRVPTPSPSTR